MQATCDVGDVHRVYEGVKALRDKREKQPCNLSTDARGTPLDDPKVVATAWEEFLKNKFAATEAENQRPEMEKLPPTQGTDQLSDDVIMKRLKMERLEDQMISR